MMVTFDFSEYGPAAKFLEAFAMRQRILMPWDKTAYSIRSRCSTRKSKHWKYYGGAGIECRITPDDLKSLFFRDKAYLMVQPSIDRIESSGHYEKSNCRWIELELNRGRARNLPRRKRRSCLNCRITIFPKRRDHIFCSTRCRRILRGE